jgi:hypothetical protein
MAKKSGAVQEELPGTESPNRDPELHTLGLELYDLQSERMQLTKDEKARSGRRSPRRSTRASRSSITATAFTSGWSLPRR